MAQKLGDYLVEAGLITKEQLEEALLKQEKTDERLGSILVQMGFIDEDDLSEALSELHDVPAVNLNDFEIELETLKLIPPEVARAKKMIPLNLTGDTLTVVVADPSNIVALDDIKYMTNLHVEPVVAPISSIESAIKKYYGEGKSLAIAEGKDLDIGSFSLDYSKLDLEAIESMPRASATEIEDPDGTVATEQISVPSGGAEGEGMLSEEDYQDLVSDAMEEMTGDEYDEEVDDAAAIVEVEAPIVKLVNGILVKAIKQGVSDIHFEPYEKSYRVRYRLDGVLRKELSLPLKIRNAITSRLKIMATLDISEKRLPQDGRIKMRVGTKHDVDFRVSSCPTLFGEKVVLRILDKSALQLDMTQLGFTEEQLAEFQEAIHKPYGMVLVTGPTGSGKTTTLYSALSQLNTITDNIMTAEDPVEYNLSGINQVQMHEEIGLNFASALRSFLRQDPDIIMVGEIRDFETAEIAVKAALTGHLVLSTIHTNDAPSTINRLLNMGIEPFLVSSSVVLILAQRLVRKICKECKEEVSVAEDALLDIGFEPDELDDLILFKGRGCQVCGNTGYKGRIALYEIMTITDEIRELILRGASSMEIKETAIAMGMKTLRDSGLQKIREGITTIEEVVRVTFGD